MVSLDLCKAYDSWSWDPFYALKGYGFGPKFLTVLWTLYSTPTARILVKVYNSHQIHIHRGTRQGCPLSSILFILAQEPLAIKLRCHPNINRIQCGDFEHKCALFCRRCPLASLLPGHVTPKSIPINASLLHYLGSINHTKSATLNLSLDADMVTQLQNVFPFKRQKKVLPYLGIFLTPTIDKLYQANYPPLYRRVIGDLQRWENNPPAVVR